MVEAKDRHREHKIGSESFPVPVSAVNTRTLVDLLIHVGRTTSARCGGNYIIGGTALMDNRWRMIKNNNHYSKPGSYPSSGGVGGKCSRNLVGARARRTSGRVRTVMGHAQAEQCCDKLTTDDIPEGIRSLYFTDERVRESVAAAALREISAAAIHGASLTADGATFATLASKRLTVSGPTELKTLDVSGSISAKEFTAKSDRRLKTDVRSIRKDRAREVIAGLKACTYAFKSEPHRARAGFIAQEVREVAPQLVSEDPDGVLGVDMMGVIPYLVAEVKGLRIELEKIRSSRPR